MYSCNSSLFCLRSRPIFWNSTKGTKISNFILGVLFLLHNKYFLILSQITAIYRILHELLHLLGFWHEHSRPDRDEHIIVHLENLENRKRHEPNFYKKDLNQANVYTDYDICSILHYNDYLFAKKGKGKKKMYSVRTTVNELFS